MDPLEGVMYDPGCCSECIMEVLTPLEQLLSQLNEYDAPTTTNSYKLQSASCLKVVGRLKARNDRKLQTGQLDRETILQRIEAASLVYEGILVAKENLPSTDFILSATPTSPSYCSSSTSDANITSHGNNTSSPAAATTTTTCGTVVLSSHMYNTGRPPALITTTTTTRRATPYDKKGEILLRWSLPANAVEVVGSFTDPPWQRCLPMHRCQDTGTFWVSLLETVPCLRAGLHQFKYLVDKEWRCDEATPQQVDDNGNSNNILIIHSVLLRHLAAATAAETSTSNDVSDTNDQDGAPACCSANNTTNYFSRSMSHIGLVSTEKRADTLRRVASMTLSGWPQSVMRHLNTPEVYLQLQVPSVRENVNLRFLCGGAMIPHPDKGAAGGADSYFIQPSAGCIGVADGVGEWDTFGLNPRLFAEQLMNGCSRHCQEIPPDEGSAQRALRIMSAAYDDTTAFGSCTALVACLDAKGQRLGVSNLGDSTCIILRRQTFCKMSCVLRTKEQQHSFNCPYQLSRLPGEEDYPTLLDEGKSTLVHVLKQSALMPQDTPSMADGYTASLQEGDLVILGTDGVFDNLFDYELCALMNLTMSPFEAMLLQKESLITSPEEVAAAIAEASLHRSIDPTARSPFARHARQTGAQFYGGKTDDITVVAAWAVRESSWEGSSPGKKEGG